MASVVAVAGQAAVVVFFVFFLLASGDFFKRKLVRLAGPSLEKRRITVQILGDINRQIEYFLLVQVATSAIVGVGSSGLVAVDPASADGLLLPPGGDAVPFTVGRLWGTRALRNRFIARLIDDRTYARLERRFREHGNWATFSCRFVPGLRWPGYFMAGTMRMPYWPGL